MLDWSSSELPFCDLSARSRVVYGLGWSRDLALAMQDGIECGAAEQSFDRVMFNLRENLIARMISAPEYQYAHSTRAPR